MYEISEIAGTSSMTLCAESQIVAWTLALWVFAKISRVSCLTVFAIFGKFKVDAISAILSIEAGEFGGRGIV